MYLFKEHLIFFKKCSVFYYLNFLLLFSLSLFPPSVQVLFVLTLPLLIQGFLIHLVVLVFLFIQKRAVYLHQTNWKFSINEQDMINRGLLCMVIVQELAIQMAQNSHNLSVTFDRDSPVCWRGRQKLGYHPGGSENLTFQYVHLKKIYYPQFFVQSSFSQCAYSNTLESKIISIGMAEDVCKGLTAPIHTLN